MVQADVSEIPDRLAGWGVAGVLSLTAIFCFWPSRPADQLRRGTAAAIEKLAELLEAMGAVARTGRAAGQWRRKRPGELSMEAYDATVAAATASVAIPHRRAGSAPAPRRSAG